MNTQDNTGKESVAQQQPSLPMLIKGHTTYKLFVPQNVEEKIRYLIRKFPSTEWSGVLFYRYTGCFEKGDLEIHCQDIFPMDLGSGTFTDFKMDENVVGYIAENIDLFGCDTGLVHSHHSLGAFLSGTDLQTVRTEGNDTNCFVSLVVDTKGTYVAAITRKVQAKKEIITKYLDVSYEFFGEGTKYLGKHSEEEKQSFVDDAVIEYFMLDVQIEQVDNPLAYLDTRFDEIEAKKKKSLTAIPSTISVHDDNRSPWLPARKNHNMDFSDDFNTDYSFNSWKNSKRKESAEAKEALYDSGELALFSEEENGEVATVSTWEPDLKVIRKLVCQIVTCSLIISDTIDLKQWVNKWMNKKYKEIFWPEGSKSSQFQEYAEFIVEFMINQYCDSCTPAELYDDMDLYQSRVASAMFDTLSLYTDGTNSYIDKYQEILTRYIYE